MILSEETRVFSYRPACLLRARGSDTATFLQGQFTNDLGNIKSGQAVYGLWLDRKGHVVADSHVIRAGDPNEFWIASLSSPAAVVARHLGEHIIADDVEIADETGDWHGVSLIGAGVGAWLAGAERPGLFFAGRRTLGENWEWLQRGAQTPPLPGALAPARTLGAPEVERLRILSGIPSVPADIGPADLPNEGGLDAQAISYSKGCYLGQEVMARIRSMGRVRRTLVRVKGPGALPPLPAALWLGERKEGELRSGVADAQGFVGLALVGVAAAGPLALARGAPATVELARGPVREAPGA
jgi:folate-binding protein YgfZ